MRSIQHARHGEALALESVALMRKKVIQAGSTIEVRLSAREIEDIRERTYADPNFGTAAVPSGANYVIRMTLEHIEIVQGYVAAEANHAKDRRLQKRLEQICDKLEEYLEAYEEVDPATIGKAEPSSKVLAFPASPQSLPAPVSTDTRRSILHRLIDDAANLGAALIEVRYKNGHEEVFATIRGFAYRLAVLRSTHPDAVELREELAILANARKRSAARTSNELRANYNVRVSTYDDFGETAYRVGFKPV